MKKIELIRAELNRAIAMWIILIAITAASAHFLAMAWICHNLLGFIVTVIFTGYFGWLAIMQALTVLHQWQKVGREQLRLDLEDAKQRFDIKF